MIDLSDPSLDDVPPTESSDSVEGLRVRNARLERERNFYSEEVLRHLSKIHELERQLTAARAVGRAM